MSPSPNLRRSLILRGAISLLISLLVGYLCSEVVTAALAYYGINVGVAIDHLFDSSLEVPVATRDIADDIYLIAHRSPVPTPNRDITAELARVPSFNCIGQGMGPEQRLRNLYTLKYASLGLTPPNIDVASCANVDLAAPPDGRHRQRHVWSTFVRQYDGPTCRLDLCATDVWLYQRGSLVLSVRAHKIGVSITSTNGMRDIVVDDYYLFVWNKRHYVPRYF